MQPGSDQCYLKKTVKDRVGVRGSLKHLGSRAKRRIKH